MGSVTPLSSTSSAVRRNNNRRSSSPEEYEAARNGGALLPLHSNQRGGSGIVKNKNNDNSFLRNKTARRKMIGRSNNKPVHCCGVKVDVPVVGVVTLLFVGIVFLVAGTTSLLHRSSFVGTDSDGHKHNHHHRNKHHQQQQRRRTNEFEPEDYSDDRRIHGGGTLAVPTSPVRSIREDENDTKNYEYYDVAIAGAGPSGLTAALFASRAGLRVYVTGSPASGLLSQTKRLDNFPSFVARPSGSSVVRSGPDWVETTLEQAKSWGATFAPPGLLATSIERQRIATDNSQAENNDDDDDKDVYFALSTGASASEQAEIRAWSVVVASGATPRTLGLGGEDALWGNSLHNCAICDGHLYQETPKKPTTVLVVGGGDAAIDSALLLARYATKVVIVHRRDEFTSAHNLANLHGVRSTPNIEMLTPYEVKTWITKENDPSQLVGARLVSSVSSGEKERLLDIDGAFVMIGATPNTGWMKDLGIALDEEGLIQTTVHLPRTANSKPSMLTASSVPGLFAAGEVTDNVYKQAITAAAAGAQAAIDTERWLREQRGVLGSANSQVPDETNKDAVPPAKRKAESVAATPAQSKRSDGQKGSDASRPAPDNCDLSSEDCIRSIVGSYPVVVFSKPWCPYCRKALESISLAGLPEGSDELLVIDLSKHSDTQAIQSTLQKMTGRRTVPNVFVGGKSIGGGDETRSFQQSGKLAPMLTEAGALGNSNINTDNVPKAEQQRKMQFEKLSTPKAPISKNILPEHRQESPEAQKAATETKRPPNWHSSAMAESCDLSSEACVHQIIQLYPIVLFSLSWCPECKRSLELLRRIGITEDQIHIIDLDDYKPEALDIRANMKTVGGRRGVPNLYVGGEFVGGYFLTSELHAAGKLVPMFQNVGALARLD